MLTVLAQLEGSMEEVHRLEWAGLPGGWSAVFGFGVVAGEQAEGCRHRQTDHPLVRRIHPSDHVQRGARPSLVQSLERGELGRLVFRHDAGRGMPADPLQQ